MNKLHDMDDEMETRGMNMETFVFLRGREEITVSDFCKPVLKIKDAGYQSVRLYFKNRTKLETFIEQVQGCLDDLDEEERQEKASQEMTKEDIEADLADMKYHAMVDELG